MRCAAAALALDRAPRVAEPELLRYATHVADRFALRNDIHLDTRLTEATWDEPSERWRAAAQTGEHWSARYLVMAIGPLSTPNTPAFDGPRKFRRPDLAGYGQLAP